MARRVAADSASGAPDALARLIAEEQSLEAMLARARQDASTMLADARAETAAEQAQVQQRIEAEAKAARHARAESRQARVAAIAAESGRDAARYDAVSDDEVDALAEWVIARLLEEPSP